ncbi:hypothetical protein ACUL41_11875 [Virgibacillus natechei]|uniref:hypothetical protein n=1 Tax=Virgibacillus sp. CBA3643 TaxID=2942278 RepID=UPI0035A26AF8
MSDKKQVIHVKDLVIKADNVYIEPPRRERRDPFFFGSRDDRKGDAESLDHKEEDHKEKDKNHKEESSEHQTERRPFWF